MRILLLSAATIAGLVYGNARRKASKIQSNPDRYPLDVLRREPQGEEVFIEREDGTEIRALSAGSGPAVVLAHGYAMTLLGWNITWSMLLEAGYRVITFDQRGHGKSTIGSGGIGSRQMAGDYRAVLQHFEVRGGVLVGHSMGGFLALKLILSEPDCAADCLTGLVLLASTAGDVLKGAPQNWLQSPLLKLGLMQKIAASETFGWSFGASLFGQSPSPAAIKAFLEVYCEQRVDRLAPILSALYEESYYGRLGEVKLPTVIICGRADKTTPPWHSETLGRDIPGARNVWVPGKGHLLNWEAPEAVVRAVKSLLPVPPP